MGIPNWKVAPRNYFLTKAQDEAYYNIHFNPSFDYNHDDPHCMSKIKIRREPSNHENASEHSSSGSEGNRPVDVDSAIIGNFLSQSSLDARIGAQFPDEETYAQFQKEFASSQDCVDLLYRSKWPTGFCCPQCEYKEAYVVSSRVLPLYQCRSCRHQTSLTAGTIMEGSRTPLIKWMYAIWLVAHPILSINAARLSSVIKVTYKTAWSILNKIRNVISEGDRKRPLSGNIMAGFTNCFIPYQLNSSEQHPQAHPVLIAAVINSNGESTQLKVKQISKEHRNRTQLLKSGIEAFTNEHTVKGLDRHTDVTTVAKNHIHFKRFNLLKGLMKRVRTWINDTFHGLGPAYLQSYLDEYCFRFNFHNIRISAADHLASLCMKAVLK